MPNNNQPEMIANTDTSDDALVRIRNLHFSRGRKKIFDGIDLDIPRGKITALMGPSGTGKTTLLRIIGGEIVPDSGSVEVDGQRVDKLNQRQLMELRKRMSMLFQNGALFTDLSSFDNVAFPLREHTELSESMIRKLVLMKLEAVGLRGVAELFPAELSGGMSRRVALARSIALDPMMVMYDEPFTGQDPISLGVLTRLIEALNDTMGLTSIVVSHDLKEATSISDYVCIFAGGKVIGQGTPEELRESDNALVKQFMAGEPDGAVPFHQPAPPLAEQLLGDAA